MRIPASLIACFASAYLLSGCNSSTGPGLPTPDQAPGLLTAHPWIPAAHSISPPFDVDDDGDADANLFAVEDDCEHDDILTFSADGSWQDDEGPNVCEGSPQIESGSWSLNAAGDTVSLGNGIALRIIALSATSLSVSGVSDEWPDGAARTEIFTWKAK